MTKATNELQQFAQQLPSIVTLLLKDHEAMRKLMAGIGSKRASPVLILKRFKALKDLVNSHMAAEEKALLDHLKSHPKFKDEALESYEEHRIHELIFRGIAQVTNRSRKIMQMKIYCEMLEHHLKEEEKDIFPKYKSYFALSTRKKAGKKFLKKRKATSRGKKPLGSLSAQK